MAQRALCQNLKKVVFTNTVSLPSQAFYNCSNIQSIILPETLESISYEAFYGCSVLTNISIPLNIKSIAASAFKNCFGLTNITFPME